jgi:translation elongation factor EF-G
MTQRQNLLKIYKYGNIELDNIYYDTAKDEFYVKKSNKLYYFTPLKWKHVNRKYTDKNNENKQKAYHYIHFYNPETKEKIRISDDQWLHDKKDVLEQNKQKENEIVRAIYSEILNNIFKILTEMSTTTKNPSENISENTSENISENTSKNTSRLRLSWLEALKIFLKILLKVLLKIWPRVKSDFLKY